ncbi:MAG: outer membrane beta-barrel protein [Stagnimonas sp.]|nr:outer membrane beta-barrel protein [Stagnimonas sp.]
MKKTLLLCAGLLGPAGVFAGSPAANGVDLFVGAAELKLSDSEDSVKFSGYDYGTRAAFALSPNVFVSGEYVRSTTDKSVDDVKIEIEPEELRIGGGVKFATSKAVNLFMGAQYARMDLDITASDPSGSETISAKADGYTLFGGADYSFNPGITLYGRLGYMSLDDDGDKMDGLDFLAGAQYPISPSIGLFGEFRLTDLEFEGDGGSITFTAYRGGVRFSF